MLSLKYTGVLNTTLATSSAVLFGWIGQSQCNLSMALYITKYGCRQTCLCSGGGTSEIATLVDHESLLKSRYGMEFSAFVIKEVYFGQKCWEEKLVSVSH
ncbi:hypothetical protein AgCh_014742 [Apium graveolens]